MELKEKQKHMCLLITLHISVNSNLILIVFLGYPSVLSYEAICFSKMMSIAIVLQTLLRLVIYIKRILKPIVKLTFDSHHKLWLAYLGNMTNNSLNAMISKIRYGL